MTTDRKPSRFLYWPIVVLAGLLSGALAVVLYIAGMESYGRFLGQSHRLSQIDEEVRRIICVFGFGVILGVIATVMACRKYRKRISAR